MQETQTIYDEKLASTFPTACLGSRQQRRGISITNLPPEILLEILSHLHAVDRICFSLTCKTLLFRALPTLRVTSTEWVRFPYRPWTFLVPQVSNLYHRLADGWLPRHQYRFCRRCHRILPRCAEYFKPRLRKKRMPRFDFHVGCTGVTEKEWKSMGKKRRFAYFVDIWCRSGQEDDCDLCFVGCSQKDRELGTCTIHCPLCLERDLTTPRKPWFRKALRSGCRNFCLPAELLLYWSLVCCVCGVKFVCDQVKRCRGLCCSGR